MLKPHKTNCPLNWSLPTARYALVTTLSPQSLLKSLWAIAILAMVALAPSAHSEGAGIATDGSFGIPAQDVGGANMAIVDIPQNLGKVEGSNLFHSFATFNIDQGQTVTFQENITNSLDNVFARVTGGTASEINGSLVSTPGGHANFYLINPAGVMFGNGAKIDVAGDFHVSTADEIRFQDGSIFSASAPNSSSLSAAAPTAFGFSGTTTANNSLLKIDGAQLAATSGKTIDMVGGNISLVNGASLTAETGEIRLVAQQGAGETSLVRDDNGQLGLPIDAPTADTAGDITIQDSKLDSSGDGGGRIGVWGEDLKVQAKTTINVHNIGSRNANPGAGILFNGHSIALDASTLSITNSGPGNSGEIKVVANEELDINQNTSIYSFVSGSGTGKGGNVELVGGNNVIVYGAIRTLSNDKGRAGDVLIQATNGNVELRNEAILSSNSFADGLVGSINISAGKDAVLKNGASISSQSLAAGSVDSVIIEAGRDVLLEAGGSIVTETWGTGRAGSVSIYADGFLNITGESSGIESFAADFSNGDAGILTINTGGVLVQDHGYITADARGEGNGGKIGLVSLGPVSLFSGGKISSSSFYIGNSGSIAINAATLTIKGEDSSIKAAAELDSIGNGGNIEINTIDTIDVQEGGTISSSASGAGNGGAVKVSTAGLLRLSGDGSAILATAQNGTGNGGTVEVKAGSDVSLKNGATISSATSSQGSAGTVNVSTDGRLTLEGEGAAIGSGAVQGSFGNVGQVQVLARGNIALKGGAVITGSTNASGSAGAVFLETGGNLLIDGLGTAHFTGVASEAESDSFGDAASIRIAVAGNLMLSNGGVISSDTYAQGQGGNVFINAANIFMDRGSISAKAALGSNGSTGSIGLMASGQIFLDHASSISIENAGIAPSLLVPRFGVLTANALTIGLQRGSSITTQSSGNLSAGSINLYAVKSLYLTDASVSTSARDGDGGAVSIGSAGGIDLHNANVTTSVSGTIGNGGNIGINGNILLMQSSTITADTQATANGGNITLNLQGIVADGDNLIIGGNQLSMIHPGISGWNVIRAAAPNGVSGFIQSATPQLNLSSTLLGFGRPQFQSDELAENACTRQRGSSLSARGETGVYLTDENSLDFSQVKARFPHN